MSHRDLFRTAAARRAGEAAQTDDALALAPPVTRLAVIAFLAIAALAGAALLTFAR